MELPTPKRAVLFRIHPVKPQYGTCRQQSAPRNGQHPEQEVQHEVQDATARAGGRAVQRSRLLQGV